MLVPGFAFVDGYQLSLSARCSLGTSACPACAMATLNGWVTRFEFRGSLLATFGGTRPLSSALCGCMSEDLRALTHRLKAEACVHPLLLVLPPGSSLAQEACGRMTIRHQAVTAMTHRLCVNVFSVTYGRAIESVDQRLRMPPELLILKV